MLAELVAAASAAGTVHGYRQALEQTAENLRQTAAGYRGAAAETLRKAEDLEAIAKQLEAEAKRRQPEQASHQQVADGLLAKAQTEQAGSLQAPPKSEPSRPPYGPGYAGIRPL